MTTKRIKPEAQCLVINTKDVATILGVCELTVQRYVRSGKIPQPRFKFRKWGWIRKDFEAWLNNEPAAIAAHEQELKLRAERAIKASKLVESIEGDGGRNPVDSNMGKPRSRRAHF